MIAGFVIGGSTAKSVIVRGIGPSLASFGLQGLLADPVLELYGPTGTLLASNDNWMDTQQAEIVATGRAPSDPNESAIVMTLPPGPYTAIVRGAGMTTGNALVEVFDLEPTGASHLTNISTRGLVGTADAVMIGGLVVGPGLGVNGSGSVQMVVRAIGPTLAQFNIPGTLQNPNLTIYDESGAIIGFNDNWKDTQQAAIQATGQAPSDDREAAILITLPAGRYTAIVRGNAGTTGVARIDAIVVP